MKIKKYWLLAIVFVMAATNLGFGYGGNTTFYCSDLKILGEKNPCRGQKETYSPNYKKLVTCMGWEVQNKSGVYLGNLGIDMSYNQCMFYDTNEPNKNISNCLSVNTEICIPDGYQGSYSGYNGIHDIRLFNNESTTLYLKTSPLGVLGLCGRSKAHIEINVLDPNYNIGQIYTNETINGGYVLKLVGNETATNYKWTIPEGWNTVIYLTSSIAGPKIVSTSRTIEGATLKSIIVVPVDFTKSNCGKQIKVDVNVKCGGYPATSSFTLNYTPIYPTINNITSTVVTPSRLQINRRFDLDIQNLKSEPALTGIKWEVYTNTESNNGWYSTPVYTEIVPVASGNNSTFIIPFINNAALKTGGKYYSHYGVKATSIYSCGYGNSKVFPFAIVPQTSKITVSANTISPFCPTGTSRVFESSLSLYNNYYSTLSSVYGLSYEWKLFNKGTITPATSARFTLNNATTITNQTASNISVNYNGQTTFDLAVRVVNGNPNQNLTSNWATTTYEPAPTLATDIVLVTPPPIIAGSNFTLDVVPAGNYNFSITPKRAGAGSVNTTYDFCDITRAEMICLTAGNAVSEGFNITATNLNPTGCHSSVISKTFDIVSDQTVSTGGYMFDLYTTGMPYRGKIYIRVPAATDPNVNLGTNRFDFNLVGGSSRFTMEAWVQGKTNSYNLPFYTIFSNWNSRTQAGFKFGVNPTTNKLFFNSFGNTHESNALPVGESFTTTNRCYHVAVVSNGTTITFYINGVAAGSSTINGTMNINNGDHYLIGTDTEETTDFLGNLLPISNFVGVIREARLWNEAKDQSFIQTNMRTKIISSTSFATGLVSYLRLNDGAGATPIDLAGEVAGKYKPALNGIGLYYDYYPGISPRSGSATSWSQATCSEMVFRKGLEEKTTPLTTTKSQDEVSIYPNPSSGMIEILVNDTFLNATLEVYDMQGKKVITQTIADLQTKMDLSNYQAGMYFIKIGTKTFKLILAK